MEPDLQARRSFERERTKRSTNDPPGVDGGGGSGRPPGHRGRLLRSSWWKRLKKSPLSPALLPLLVVVAVASLSIVWEAAESQLATTPSASFHRTLLALRTLAVAGVAGTIVYGWMLRRIRRMERTEEKLAGLVETYLDDPGPPFRDADSQPSPARNAPPAIGNRPGEDSGSDALMFLLGEETPGTERLRERIVERERTFALGQLTSGLAHEVLNPLSCISSIVQMLARSGASPEITKQYALIETNIDRISSIVRQLSELARREDERWALVDVRRTLARILHLVSLDERARNVDISFEPPPDLPCIRTIPGQIDQVFLNLLLNALDAMPEGGTLTVRAREYAGNLIVRIRDTGVGIPAEVGQRIFSPFFTTKEPGRATGMGLAVCYAVVRRLGGIIEFDSTEGEGTVFTVIVPV